MPQARCWWKYSLTALQEPVFLVWHAVFASPLFPRLKKEYTKLAFPKSVFHGNLVPWDLYRCCRGKNFWSNHLGKSGLNKGEEFFSFFFNHRTSLSLYDAKVCGGASDRDPKSTISQTVNTRGPFFFTPEDQMFISPYFETHCSNSFPLLQENSQVTNWCE